MTQYLVHSETLQIREFAAQDLEYIELQKIGKSIRHILIDGKLTGIVKR